MGIPKQRNGGLQYSNSLQRIFRSSTTVDDGNAMHAEPVRCGKDEPRRRLNISGNGNRCWTNPLIGDAEALDIDSEVEDTE